MPSAFVSVSLSAIAEDYDPVSYNEMKSLTADFLTETGWKPVAIEYAAGAIRYTQYDFFKKFTLRQLTKRVGGNNDTSVNHEYTNWTRLSKFLTTFLNMAKAWPTLAEEIL
jgi:menaquinone-dependent protoporphyrinogen oxidase